LRGQYLKGLWVFGLLVGFVLFIAGCDSPVPRIEAVEEQGRTFAVLDYLTLVVETANGEVRIRGVDGLDEVQTTVVLHAWGDTQEQAQDRLGQLAVDMSQQADRVQLTFRSSIAYRGWGKSPQVDFELTVPSHADVAVIVKNGSVGVTDITGTLSVKADNGVVDAAGVRGAATIETTNGGIVVALAQAHLGLTADNGSITVSQSRCSLDAETDNGDVRFSGQLVGKQHRMKSGNGSVVAEIPADSELAIEARVGSGSISTSLPLVGDMQGRQWAAILNAPTSRLILQTGNGAIKIRGLAAT